MKDNNGKLIALLKEWFENGPPNNIVIRNILPADIPSSIAIVLCGVRRAGKTYFLYELAQKLKQTIPLQNIIYINFEDIRLYPLISNELKNLPEVYFENFSFVKDKPLWMLIDEIQSIENWERFVRNFLDRKIAHIVVTGSSSMVSPKEIAYSMRGRTLTYNVYPLNFREFLKFKGVAIEYVKDLLYSSQRPHFVRYLREHIEYGGFPEIVLMESKELKKKLLRELYQTIFYRDIIEHYSIRNVRLFESFLKIMVDSFSTLLSISRVNKFLTNTLGLKSTKNTLFDYLSFAKSAFLVYDVEIFSYKIKDRLQYPRKIYVIDTGLINAINFRFTENYGRLLENAVFLELLRKQKEAYYWKDVNGHEVDFVIVEGLRPRQLIQVSWSLSNDAIKKREINSLLKAMDEFKLKEGHIITNNDSGEEKVGDKWIVYKPFWLWVLGEKDERHQKNL